MLVLKMLVVKKMILYNRRITIREVADNADIVWLMPSNNEACGFTITAFTGLFPLPKIEDTDERKAFSCGWGDKKSAQELVAITKRTFHKYFKDWKKRWHKGIIYDGYFWSHLANYFSKYYERAKAKQRKCKRVCQTTFQSMGLEFDICQIKLRNQFLFF